MARRPRARVDTSRLRAMGETSAVVARPVDTYVRPAAPQKNEQYAQILSALSTVNPALDTFIADKVTKDREKQANLGEKSFYEATPEERKAMSAKIKSGEINELQSPFWVEGFARSLLRNHATTFGSALTLEWNRQKDSGGFDFNAFVAEERGKYIEANNLSSFRSDLFNDEFAAVTRTFENQVLQRNYEHRISQAKKARMQSLGDSMFTVIQGMQEALDTEKFDGQKGDTFSAQINAEIQTAIDQGLDPSGVISMAEGFLQGTILDLAQNEQNQDIAKGMLRNLKLKSGTYGIVYKDKYEAIERNADNIMLRAEADAEQADNDELESQQLSEYKEVYDGLVEAINSTDPTALNTYWKSDEVKALRRSIGYLDGITEGENLLPTLNDLFQTKGIVSAPVSDAEFVDVMNNQILGQNLNDAQVRKIAEDSGFSYPQIREAVNANNGQAAQFLKNIKLPDIEKALAAEVNTKGLFEFGDSARTSFAAVAAVAELKDFIKAQMVSMGDTPEDALAARAAVSAEAKRLAEVYGDRARLENDNFNQTNNPKMKPASQETVELWKSGQYTPWKNENGSLVAGIDGNSAEAFAAANDAGRPFDSTEIGKLIGPLILAGVSPDVILSQIATAYEAANATEKEDAQAVLAPVLEKARTRADAAVDQSKTIVGTIRPIVEPVIETALNTVSDLISGETETAVAADAALEAAQPYLSAAAKERIASGTTGENPEVTQGSGTISAEDPLFKQDNILNKTARAKAIAENAEELQRNYERESIDPPDNIGAINETIVDLGEGFLKAVARSFEATGKAGAERTRELQRFARQAALYKELLNNPNVEAQELTKKIDLATSQNIGIGNVDNSKRMAELLELRDPDKALAAAQKFLSPEAKIRIDNASALFGDASAADAALMLAQPYLSEEAKQRILTRFPVIKPQEAQPPVDLRGRSSPTAQTAEQEADTAGDAGKLGSSSTDTGTKVFQLKSVLEQNGKVPLLSATKDAVKGEKAKKLAIRSWKKAFGKHYRENGTAKPAFMKQALDIAQQTETDVTTVIKAVLGTNPSANKLLVTSGLTATEAQQLHKKYQEIRRLFEQMQGDNS